MLVDIRSTNRKSPGTKSICRIIDCIVHTRLSIIAWAEDISGVRRCTKTLVVCTLPNNIFEYTGWPKQIKLVLFNLIGYIMCTGGTRLNFNVRNYISFQLIRINRKCGCLLNFCSSLCLKFCSVIFLFQHWALYNVQAAASKKQYISEKLKLPYIFYSK